VQFAIVDRLRCIKKIKKNYKTQEDITAQCLQAAFHDPAQCQLDSAPSDMFSALPMAIFRSFNPITPFFFFCQFRHCTKRKKNPKEMNKIWVIPNPEEEEDLGYTRLFKKKKD
jgi:hypothetical protein